MIKERKIEYASYPAIVLILLLFLLPLSFTLSSAFTEGSFLKVYSNRYTFKIIGFTLYQAFLSTLFSLIIGLPGAYIIAKYNFPLKKVLVALCKIPFVLPSILVVLGFVIFYGNSGFLNTILMKLFNLQEPPLKILYSFKTIILAHSFYNFPIVMNTVSNTWQALDTSCEQASRTLGATSFQTFLKVTLPRLRTSILSAATLIFLFCFTSFAIILVLGGGPQFTTIEVEIYNLAKRSMDTGAAAALSLASLLISIIILLLNQFFQKKSFIQTKINTRFKSFKSLSTLAKVLIIIYSLALIFFVLAPIVSIFVRSLINSSSRGGTKAFGFASYQNLLKPNITKAIVNTLIISIVSSFFCLISALLLTLRKSSVWEIISMLPMAVSSVIIGLGYFMLDRVFTNNFTFLAIVLCHIVICLPFALRTIIPFYHSLPTNLILASRTLGATRVQTLLKIEIPLMLGCLITAFTFCFAISLGEMNATLMLSNSKIETMVVVIYRLINSYNYQGACALGSLLIVICLILFLLSEAIKKRS